MPNFLYTATNAQGKTVTGSLEANDRSSAIASLKNKISTPSISRRAQTKNPSLRSTCWAEAG